MRKFIRGSLFIFIPGIIIYLSSCAPGSCFEETECFLKASFYKGTVLSTPDSLTLYGLDMDSIIYAGKSGVQPALIPLNSSAESSRFVIVINGITDTIEFRYSSYPHLISKECGYTFYHHLDSIPPFTKNIIKDIFLNNPTVTNLNEENIRIFY
jgi:hypothetical protein